MGTARGPPLYEHSPDELDALDALAVGDAAVDGLDAVEAEEERRHAFKGARCVAMRAGDVLFMSAEVLHCSGPPREREVSAGVDAAVFARDAGGGRGRRGLVGVRV